jgi:hypothetical protein
MCYVTLAFNVQANRAAPSPRDDNCKDVLQALQNKNFTEFASLITDILPAVRHSCSLCRLFAQCFMQLHWETYAVAESIQTR